MDNPTRTCLITFCTIKMNVESKDKWSSPVVNHFLKRMTWFWQGVHYTDPRWQVVLSANLQKIPSKGSSEQAHSHSCKMWITETPDVLQRFQGKRCHRKDPRSINFAQSEDIFVCKGFQIKAHHFRGSRAEQFKLKVRQNKAQDQIYDIPDSVKKSHGKENSKAIFAWWPAQYLVI